MNVLVINGSPSGDDSITLQTVLYIQKSRPDVSFEFLNAAWKIRSIEKDFAPVRRALEQADLLLFSYPVYTFLVPAQLHRFLELVKDSGAELRGKYATQITTSKHFYDTTAHQFIQDNCADLGLRYVRGLSADMEDLLHKKGQKEALDFFRYVCWSMEQGISEPVLPRPSELPELKTASLPEHAVPDSDRTKRVVVVTDLDAAAQPRLAAMIDRFRTVSDAEVSVVNLREFPFAGGCLGCFRCASEGKCVYKDGFDVLLREHIQTGDAIVYAYTIRDHSMGYRFKLYDDRQFCNGHRTVTMGKPVGYLIDGHLAQEPNLQILMEARAQVGGNFLAGIAADAADPDGEIDALARKLSFALRHDYQPPKTFYGVGGLKIFRDLIYQMQGLMREDHRFYKEHGFYDFPQKRRAAIAGMYLVGSMMKNEKLSKKLSSKMTGGMIMPYKAVLNKADKKSSRKGRLL